MSYAPRTVVVLVHGIRTHASWQELVKEELAKFPDVNVVPIGYGYFDAFRFWFPFIFRGAPINWIVKELRNIRSEHKLDSIIVIAHSFGTYAVTEILSKHPDVEIDGLLLCGSIVRRGFRWDMLPKFPPRGVVNDCGAKDAWPILAKCMSWGYGPTGTLGFRTYKIHDRFHNLGHSDYFRDKFIQTYWVPFVIDGDIVPSPENARHVPLSVGLSTLSWLPLKTLMVSIPVIIIWLVY